jgi:hypothetical protein
MAIMAKSLASDSCFGMMTSPRHNTDSGTGGGLAGSPSLDVETSVGCPDRDQRGVPRPQGGTAMPQPCVAPGPMKLNPHIVHKCALPLAVPALKGGMSARGASDSGVTSAQRIRGEDVMSHLPATPRDVVIQSWRQLPKLVGLSLLAGSLILEGAVADAGLTVRVSVASDGTQGNHFSFFPALSADGRFVAFESAADTLVAGNANNTIDIFVHDRDADADGILDEPGAVATVRVGVASGGPSLSADGRVVAFMSDATNLIPGDTNGDRDIFVHDRETGLTERVNVASDGAQGNDFSYDPAISADGRFVAFDSYAYNLVFGDTNAQADIFVHDRQGVVEVLCGRWAATIVGTPGDDRLVGTEGPDVIQALKGDDEVDGRGGNDLLCGGIGDDLLDGGDGDDRLYGNEGDDTLNGGLGDDRLVSGYGDDILRGGEGDDFLKGGGEDDSLEGGSGVDRCEAGQGSDTITDCEELIDAP